MKCNTCSSENVEGARFCASCGAVLGAPEQANHSLVGQMVGGRFNVKRVLGEGGMGIVYEAEQQMGSAARKVALKTLHAHLSHDPSVSQRFHRECGTIAQLEHPNTIKVYDFGATPDGTLYIAMEFVAGKALSKLIEETGPLPPDRVLKIMKQITGSLQEAHEQGVIHRDLKPDNVILTNRAGETDVVKLLDFGIAARTESADAQREQKLTQQGMVLGTPPYMSPEQFTGKALDARSDIYSLGVMAYEMATGRLPFDANTPWQWATEHMTAKPLPFEATPVSSQIPASMRDAILRSLAKNREERQATAKQFYEELAGQGAPAAAAVAAGATSGTAAMPAAPNFGAPGAVSGTAKTAAMPTPASGNPAQAPIGAPVAAAPVIAPPLAPPRSGGKGLVFGLAGVGGVLVVGIVIVAARSMKPAQDPVPTNTVSQPSTPATIAPIATPEPTAAQTAPVPTEMPTATGAPEQTQKVHQQTEHTGTGSKSPPSPSSTSTGAPAGNSCAACLTAARSGNYGGAAAAYRSCTDAAQKSECVGLLRGKMPSAAKTAAFNGQCPQAKSIVQAGQAMGISSPDFNAALGACKGK